MRRAGLILCVALACALGAGAAPLRAENTLPATATAADGVTIGPVAVGGMTLEQATQVVVDAYLSPLTLRVGGTTLTVSPRRFHTVAPVAAAVAQALAAPAGTAVPLRASLNAKRLAAYVDELARRYRRAPVASRMVLRHLHPYLTAPRPGLRLKELPAQVLIRNAIRTADRSAPVVLPVRWRQPPATATHAPVIVIRRGSNRLYLYRGVHFVRSFPVATGQRAYPTPLGRFEIVVKWKNPTWYPPVNDAWAKGLKPVPPGPNNPLGTRWMGLSAPGVGIHGTDDPASIGYSVSHGCIRMQVPQAEWLFDHVTIGTPVFIVSK